MFSVIESFLQGLQDVAFLLIRISKPLWWENVYYPHTSNADTIIALSGGGEAAKSRFAHSVAGWSGAHQLSPAQSGADSSYLPVFSAQRCWAPREPRRMHAVRKAWHTISARFRVDNQHVNQTARLIFIRAHANVQTFPSSSVQSRSQTHCGTDWQNSNAYQSTSVCVLEGSVCSSRQGGQKAGCTLSGGSPQPGFRGAGSQWHWG